MRRSACGQTMPVITSLRARPSEYAASDWPRSMVWIPLLKMLLRAAELYRPLPMTMAQNGVTSTPSSGRPKKQNRIMSSVGMARNSSAYAPPATLKTRYRLVCATATTAPSVIENTRSAKATRTVFQRPSARNFQVATCPKICQRAASSSPVR